MKIAEIKKTAKIKLTGNYIKCCSSSLLYFLIITVITFIQSKSAQLINNTLILAFVQAIFLIINWIFCYGIISNILELVNVKTNSITDFINISLNNYVKTTKIGFRILLKILIPLIIFIFAIFYFIGTSIANIKKINFLCFNKNLVPLSSFILIITVIALIYFIIKYALSFYIFYNNPEMSEKDIVEKSKKLMNGNIFNYIKLLLSFLHWFLICALVLLILNTFIQIKYLTPFIIFFYSILRPYVVTSKFEFYKELEDIKEEKVEKDN